MGWSQSVLLKIKKMNAQVQARTFWCLGTRKMWTKLWQLNNNYNNKISHYYKNNIINN